MVANPNIHWGESTERAPAAIRTTEGPRANAYFFVVLECQRPLAGGMRISLHGIDEVRVGRGEHRRVERVNESGYPYAKLRVGDRQMSNRHARLIREQGEWHLEDCGSTNGTFCRGERVTRTALRDGDSVLLGQTIFSFREILQPSTKRMGDFDSEGEPEALRGLATLDPSLAVAIDRLSRIATSSVPVMLLGESGTGKELLAQAIHKLSRRPGPLVAVNCGAIPEALIEGTLFGHKKGAFSGALRDEDGLVRAADHGTVFFDEVGDLPMASQAALLRVLQEGEVVPVGATKPTKVDIRFVCATHKPLEEMAEKGLFRRDLFARLAGFSHPLAPLRDRRVDLGLLVSSLLCDPSISKPAQIRIAPEAARAIARYDWPLNIRELKQCLAASSALARDGWIGLAELPASVARALEDPWEEESHPGDENLRRSLILQLVEARGNVSEVARAMGKARQQIQRWLRRLQIDADAFRIQESQ